MQYRTHLNLPLRLWRIFQHHTLCSWQSLKLPCTFLHYKLDTNSRQSSDLLCMCSWLWTCSSQASSSPKDSQYRRESLAVACTCPLRTQYTRRHLLQTFLQCSYTTKRIRSQQAKTNLQDTRCTHLSLVRSCIFLLYRPGTAWVHRSNRHCTYIQWLHCRFRHWWDIPCMLPSRTHP